ncbi:uncharacterized, partial [Tachysurus ichikawai]
ADVFAYPVPDISLWKLYPLSALRFQKLLGASPASPNGAQRQLESHTGTQRNLVDGVHQLCSDIAEEVSV